MLAGCVTDRLEVESESIIDARFSGYEQAVGDEQYLALLARSASRDEKAIRVFLSIEQQYAYDGAASEGHAAVLGFLLRHTGDDFFGSALSECDTKAQEHVRGLLYFDMAHDWDEVKRDDAEALLQYEYPITFAQE